MPNPFELRGKRVLVVGLAKTGVATALFCAAFPMRCFSSLRDNLLVIACFHASPDPSHWQRRT